MLLLFITAFFHFNVIMLPSFVLFFISASLHRKYIDAVFSVVYFYSGKLTSIHVRTCTFYSMFSMSNIVLQGLIGKDTL